MEEISTNPWGIWKQSASFYKTHWDEIAPLVPLLFIPVFVDAFIAFLMIQNINSGSLQPFRALQLALKNTPRLFILKLRFEISGGLWSFIPLFGWYKAYRHRIAWAMASNVIAFEDLPIALALKRCSQLVEIADPGKSLRTLITIPAAVEVMLLILLAFGAYVLDSPLFFWVSTFFFFWTLLPWSAAVNTFFYLSLPKNAVKETLAPYKRPLLYQDFCPQCAFFLSDQGICGELKFNVIRYPEQFSKRCNSISFRPRGAT